MTAAPPVFHPPARRVDIRFVSGGIGVALAVALIVSRFTLLASHPFAPVAIVLAVLLAALGSFYLISGAVDRKHRVREYREAQGIPLDDFDAGQLDDYVRAVGAEAVLDRFKQEHGTVTYGRVKSLMDQIRRSQSATG